MTSRNGAGSASQPRANPSPTAVVVNEGFDDVTTLEGAGWFIQNNSNPIGDFSWGQGNPVSNDGPFDAFDGDPDAYVSVNFQSTDGAGTINNWLVTPTIAFGTGSSLSFYTRTEDDPIFPDRLEVRLCTADPCTNVGATETDTGDFGTLLLSINPNLLPGDDPTGLNGYPAEWTQFNIASGLPTSGNGRIAFRYFVTDGGPAGDNSDFIGVDRVVIDNGTTGGGGDPIIGVSPTSLSASLPPNKTTTQTLTIANSGDGTLNWTIDEAAPKSATLPHTHSNSGAQLIRNASTASLSLAGASHSAPFAPWRPLGNVLFQYDDGTAENAVGFGNTAANTEKAAIYLDHFTATGALTIDSVSMLWSDTTHVGALVGKQPNIVAYYDASSSGDVTNAIRLGSDNVITIGSEGAFENYPTSFSVPGAGDVYVGFTDTWAADGTFTPLLHPGAVDQTSSAGESWLVATSTAGVPTDINTLSNNDFAGVIDGFGLPGNWMIRATGSSGGGGGGCSSPSDLPWVSVNPTSGATAAAGSSNVTVTYDSTGLSPGSYDGLLCVGSNDPVTPSVEVPVSLTVTSGGGANGIILSGPLDHAVADNIAGTTLNMTTSAFDDTGPISGDWDFNFYDIDGFSFYTIDTYNTQYVVDNTGNVIVLHVGDVVGPSSVFSTNASTGNVPSAPEWAAGTDGYAGVRFNCDGRLPNPVAGGVCYGYVHITTTGSTGFPATIDDTGFDGDGNAITITGSGGGGDPTATVTPTSLDFTVAADATATQPLNIANAAGSNPLTYSIETRGNRPMLVPHVGTAKNRGGNRNVDIGKLEQLDRLRHRPAPQLTSHPAPAQKAPAPWAPVGVDGTPVVFEVDDGTYEDVIGLNNAQGGGNESFGAVWVNQFSATGPLTIDSISIEWPSTSGIVIGMQPNLLVYYDASSSGDLTQAVRLGTDTIVTIGSLDAFETYTTSFSVPGAGDVYIGFDDAWALVDGGFEGIVSPAAIDENSTPGAAWVSGQSAAGVLTDLNNLANNDLTGTAAGFGFPGNWLVRATGTAGGSGGPCTGPIVNWLSANPTNGTVTGGANTNVSIKADPAAGGLAAGDYTGEVCVTTNDPAHPLIAVPVSLTVTPAAAVACNGGADEIFCDGFDPAQAGGNVVTGTINQPVADNADGSSFDFALQDYHAYDPSITADDINLYDLSPGGMFVYWYGDVVPPAGAGLTGGVVDSGGVDFAVLHSGDKIGPSSVVSAGSIAMTNWQGGTDGYVGVAFWNESTSAVNYGYIHMTTQSPEGFPAQVLDWAYDNSGAAITIP